MTRRGMTLIEVTVAVTVLAVMAAVMLPVLHGSADAFGAASRSREAFGKAGFAMDRVLRMLREVPITESGQLAISQATESMLEFADGSGVELVGTDLVLNSARAEAVETAVLCRAVERFELRWLDASGVVGAGPVGDAVTFEVSLAVSGVELRTAAFPRVRMVQQ